MRHCIVLFILLCWTFIGTSQSSAYFTNANQHFHRGVELYEQQLFGLARTEFTQASKLSSQQFDEKSKQLGLKSELYEAKASVLGKFPEGEKLLLDYYIDHNPNPLAYEAAKMLGDIQYRRKRYDDALEFYNDIPASYLSESDNQDLLFKKGYSYFLVKDFAGAERNFNPILGEDTEYYFQTYYYMAMIKFFGQDYDKAIEYFFVLENYPEYKTRIPYYIAQIYFEQKQYDDILEYIPNQLKNPGIENKKELRHILGQTLFLRKDYKAALPHLENYESLSNKMRKEDFYQLAFTQYQLGLYEKAAPNFKELSKLKTEMGQISNNYLADAYLRLGNKEEARVSFKNVMDYEFNEDLRQEAAFNYGKLSAELGYDRAAIKALVSLPPSATNYGEAQKVLGKLFETSKDYSMVIQTIEGLDYKAPEILKAYQKVVLERGIQLINDGERELALKTLMKAAETPADNFYTAVIFFHIADLQHQKGNYKSSINYLNQYFTLEKMSNELPQTASPVLAHYLQGYNHLKTKKNSSALSQFEESKSEMLRKGFVNSSNIRERRIYADVLNRLGDVHFKLNSYGNASKNYGQASQIDFPGRDYAFFQLAMIKGLQGNPYEKIVLLEELLDKTPNSSFKDDTYFQIGETQMQLNQPRNAELAYQEILSLKGRSPLITRALLKLGLIAYNKGETQKAIKYYTQLFENNPSKSEAQEALLALEEIYIQDLGKAEDFADLVEKTTGYKMSSLKRDSLSYIAAQGKFENGEYIEAIESYTQYIDKFPKGINRLKALYNRADSKTILKQYSEALPDYDLVINAGQSEYYEEAIHRAALIAYNDIEKFEEAFNYYSLLEDVTSDELLKYEAQVGAMRSAFRFGNENATIMYSSKVILNPLSNAQDKGLSNFFAGKMNYASEKWVAARANFEQVLLLTDNENTAEARFLRNDILYRMGDLEIAEEITLESVSNSTAYPYWVAKNLLLLSDIMVDSGDIFNAKAAVEAVVENFPESSDLQEQAEAKLKIILEKEALENRIEEESSTINLDTINRNE